MAKNKWDKLKEILGDEVEIAQGKHGSPPKPVWEKRLWKMLTKIANDGKKVYGRLGSILGGKTFPPKEIDEILQYGKEINGFRYIYKDNIGLAQGEGKRIVGINIDEEKFIEALRVENE